MPIAANMLMTKYNVAEGKILGDTLKMIEEIWINNGFKVSDKEIKKITKG